jgi:hypothetical protein
MKYIEDKIKTIKDEIEFFTEKNNKPWTPVYREHARIIKMRNIEELHLYEFLSQLRADVDAILERERILERTRFTDAYESLKNKAIDNELEALIGFKFNNQEDK